MDTLFLCVALMYAGGILVAIQVLLNHRAIVMINNNFIELTQASKDMVKHMMKHEDKIKELIERINNYDS